MFPVGYALAWIIKYMHQTENINKHKSLSFLSTGMTQHCGKLFSGCLTCPLSVITALMCVTGLTSQHVIATLAPSLGTILT
jgi:hypothetical protein